jgi:hypothetical protein
MENTIANIRILDVVRLVHGCFIFDRGETTQGGEWDSGQNDLVPLAESRVREQQQDKIGL